MMNFEFLKLSLSSRARFTTSWLSPGSPASSRSPMFMLGKLNRSVNGCLSIYLGNELVSFPVCHPAFAPWQSREAPADPCNSERRSNPAWNKTFAGWFQTLREGQTRCHNSWLLNVEMGAQWPCVVLLRTNANFCFLVSGSMCVTLYGHTAVSLPKVITFKLWPVTYK